MEKVLVGYKQGDGSYAYVSSMDAYNINMTTLIEGAINFNSNETAKSICEYLNAENEEHTYTAIKVTVTLEEVK